MKIKDKINIFTIQYNLVKLGIFLNFFFLLYNRHKLTIY